MKKRLRKKKIRAMSDRELIEHVAYCDNKKLRVLLEKEFDDRFENES